MTFDRKTLIIPDGTKFDERTIITKGDVVIADRCLLQFGIKTDGRIFVGEHVIIDGGLEATKDIRTDIFSSIGRSPIPVVIYMFIYLMQLLKMGHSEEIDRILEEMEENEGDIIPISETFLFIPNNSIIGVQKSKVDFNLHVGKASRVLGNYDLKGNAFVDDGSIVHGTLKSGGDVFCGKKVTVQGNINAHGDVRVDDKTKVAGNISAEKIYLSKTASVNGTLIAKNGVSFMTPSKGKAEEKVKRFESELE